MNQLAKWVAATTTTREPLEVGSGSLATSGSRTYPYIHAPKPGSNQSLDFELLGASGYNFTRFPSFQDVL